MNSGLPRGGVDSGAPDRGTPVFLESFSAPFWNEKNHPIVVCTDDKGVFNTSLNQEYRLMHDSTGAKHTLTIRAI